MISMLRTSTPASSNGTITSGSWLQTGERQEGAPADGWMAVTNHSAETYLLQQVISSPVSQDPKEMRKKALFLAGLCGLGLSCSSATDVGEWDGRLLDYSLVDVNGMEVPNSFSSWPGPVVWEGGDGLKLAMRSGQLVCDENGSAEESYGFFLSTDGVTWDFISVEIELTCGLDASGTVMFRDRDTWEVLSGSFQEDSDGCSVLVKSLPSLESLRAGYKPSESRTGFPAALDLFGPVQGTFQEMDCVGM